MNEHRPHICILNSYKILKYYITVKLSHFNAIVKFSHFNENSSLPFEKNLSMNFLLPLITCWLSPRENYAVLSHFLRGQAEESHEGL